MNIKKDQLIHTFPEWGPKYKVEFDITVWKQDGHLKNVAHFTTDENCCSHGQRIPSFSVGYSTFRIDSSVNGNGNYIKEFNYELGKYYNIIIQQYEEEANVWKYEIKINGQLNHSDTNENHQTFKDVKFYAGDSWHSKSFTTEFGKVWDMRINDIPFTSIDCVMSEWSDWTDCSGSESYSKSKTREKLVEGNYGGLECGATKFGEL